ncbi:MAG: AraC family transcriptional regulator [Lachnospiraceae bacterium]|nr:AraC family transcriptional regulator [Lachnospiraceae bacterium]
MINNSTNKEENMHGTYSMPYEIYKTCIPDYYKSFPIHWHEEIEIVYVYSGKARYFVDFIEYVVEAGDVLIVPPGSLHSFEQIDDEEFIAATLIFNQKMLNSNFIDVCSTKYIMPIFNNEIFFQMLIKHNERHSEYIGEIIKGIIEQHISRGITYELKIKIFMLKFIDYYYENNLYSRIEKNTSNKRTSIQIRNIVNYIEENYAEKINLEDLAECANISVYHMSHIFKKITGKTPNEYVNDFRLAKATDRLINEDSSILTIAMECGYNNISYFNKVFKNKLGITPKEYRNTHKNNKES